MFMGVDATTFWLICLSVSTPIAGVIGFSIQLRNVKKIRLENEKLALEIRNLRKEHEESERRIIKPSTDEVIKYNDVMFSRRGTGVNLGPDNGPIEKSRPFISAAIELAFYLLGLVFICYLLFDIYRCVAWLWLFFKQL